MFPCVVRRRFSSTGLGEIMSDITLETAIWMEQNSETGEINIFQTKYEFIKSNFTCEYCREIDEKNKRELTIYFVESNK